MLSVMGFFLCGRNSLRYQSKEKKSHNYEIWKRKVRIMRNKVAVANKVRIRQTFVFLCQRPASLL